MSIEIIGDITEEQFQQLCKEHSSVLVMGNIITKKDREEKELKEHQAKMEKEKIERHNNYWVLLLGVLVFVSSFVLCLLD